MVKLELTKKHISVFWAVKRTTGERIRDPIKHEIRQWIEANAPTAEIQTEGSKAYAIFANASDAVMFKLAQG